MNSKYHQQKIIKENFNEQMDSDEDKIQIETFNTNEISNDKNTHQEEMPENSPYVMTIEIDKGISEKLQIFYDSVPEEVAFEFCKKHNLDYTALSYLIDEIKTVLNQNQLDEKTQNWPIQEEEDESLASEEISKKNGKSDDVLPNVIKECNTKSKNTDKINNEISIKEESQKNDLTNPVNQSTNYNDLNHTEILTHSNNKDNSRMLKTEPALFESSMEVLKQSANNSGTFHSKKKDMVRLKKENEFNSLDQKLFSYQIFLDKYNYKNMSTSTLNNSNNKSIKNLSTNESVFDKLYKEAKERKQNHVRVAQHQLKNNNSKDHLQTLLNTNLNKHIIKQINKTNNTFHHHDNVGERLYKNGLNLKEGVEAKISNQRKEQMEKNKEIFTFKPNINKKHYCNLNYTTNNDDNILVRFEQYRRNKDIKLKVLRERYEEKEDYSFVPKIDSNSMNIVRSKYQSMMTENDESKNINEKVEKHKELYELSRLKPLKIRNLEMFHYGQFNYQPVINPNSTAYSDFFTRQESFSKKKAEKHIKYNYLFNLD